MSVIDKKKIVRSSITQAGVPVLFDEIISGEAKIQESKSVSYVENGVYSVVPDTDYDAIAQVNVTVDVPAAPGGPVTSFEDPIVFDSIEDMEELNSYNVKGALVSYNASTGKYTAWNGEADLDARAWDYRADASSHASSVNHSLSGEWINRYASSWSEDVVFPTNDYGEVIAVCVGNGFWVSTKWDPTNAGSNYKWCKSEGTIYGMQAACLLPKSGPECTTALTALVTSEDESLFWNVKEFGASDLTQGHLYVPSSPELITAKYNAAIAVGAEVGSDPVASDFTTALAHACKITGAIYWSSSQSNGSQDCAYNLDNNGYVNITNKDYTYACLVFVRFGAALASTVSDQGIGVE